MCYHLKAGEHNQYAPLPGSGILLLEQAEVLQVDTAGVVEVGDVAASVGVGGYVGGVGFADCSGAYHIMMPELPEAESIVRALRPHLCGKTLTRVALHRPAIVRAGRRAVVDGRGIGRVIAGVSRSGKRVVIEFTGGARLVVALGMTGRLTVVPTGEPLLKHTHFQARITGTGTELRFRDPRRFGGIWYLDKDEPIAGPRLGPLGPDALSVRLPVFRDLLRRKRQIKALLLDQRAIAGLGNIYCDEALHRTGIHPATRAADLAAEQVKTLLRQIRTVLRSAIRHGGSTFMDYRNADGRPGGFQLEHRAYDRQGQPCRGCGATILRIQVAGRSSHICPSCQRPPR